MMRRWLNIIMLLACGFGAYGVLSGAASYSSRHWQYYLYLISPWVLLYGSLKAWHKNFIWRRMLSNRNINPVLSRGQHRPQRDILRPNILEHSCKLLFLLAVAAILKQLSVSHINWWIGSLIGAWLTLCAVLLRKK